MRLSSLFVLSSVIASGLALPTTNFASQLNDLRYKVDSLSAQIRAFPTKGGTFEEAIKLHGSAKLLQANLGQYTSDLYHYSKFNEAESHANMNAAGKLEKSSEATLDEVVAKKETFQHIHHGSQDVLSLFIADIKSIASVSDTFINALIDHTDHTHVSEAKALQDKLGVKFEYTLEVLERK